MSTNTLEETVKRPILSCKICGNTNNNAFHVVREMMYGSRDQFTYLECGQCQCLQLMNPPEELARYYPTDYYSFTVSPDALFHNPLKNVVKGIRISYAATQRGGLIGKVLDRSKPDPILHTLSPTHITKQSRILDVGSGSGDLLYRLRVAGFNHTVGIDPYINSTIVYNNGLHILKEPIYSMGGEWDLIMFHHVFEHLADPLETLQATQRLLSPSGFCLIRIPICSSYAWQHYGVHWAQLDAPRHFFLHSVRSMQHAANKTGFKIAKILYDSNEFQFWASEQYRQNIGLNDPESYKFHPELISEEQMAQYRARAEELNQQQLGDQAAFYLQKL